MVEKSRLFSKWEVVEVIYVEVKPQQISPKNVSQHGVLFWKHLHSRLCRRDFRAQGFAVQGFADAFCLLPNLRESLRAGRSSVLEYGSKDCVSYPLVGHFRVEPAERMSVQPNSDVALTFC